MTWLVVGLFLVGLLVGSFLNVVVWRVPRGESIVRPGSHCPTCDSPLTARENVPVVSWLVQRRRCRHCTAPIPVRYPLVEVGTGVLFAVLAVTLGPSWDLPAFLWLGAMGVVLALIDVEHHRLPDAITLPSYVAVGALLVLPAVIDSEWGSYGRAWLAGAALFAFYFLPALVYPAGMGFGDVKLAGVLGLGLGWLGWAEVVVGTFLAFGLGALVGIGILIARRGGRRTAIPFGPYMLVGALLAIWVAGPIAVWYAGLLGLG